MNFVWLSPEKAFYEKKLSSNCNDLNNMRATPLTLCFIISDKSTKEYTQLSAQLFLVSAMDSEFEKRLMRQQPLSRTPGSPSRGGSGHKSDPNSSVRTAYLRLRLVKTKLHN